MEAKEQNAPQHLDDATELVVLRGTGKERQTEEKLDANTAKRPHIDSGRVGQAEQDLW